MSIFSEPRKPDCDVCDWATAYHYAHKMNLCQADFEIVTKVAESEQSRIIKLLKEMRDTCLTSHTDVGDHNAWALQNAIALIKGEE